MGYTGVCAVIVMRDRTVLGMLYHNTLCDTIKWGGWGSFCYCLL